MPVSRHRFGRGGPAHKQMAAARMNRGDSLDQHLRGQEKILRLVLVGATRALLRPRKPVATRVSKVAQATRQAVQAFPMMAYQKMLKDAAL